MLRESLLLLTGLQIVQHYCSIKYKVKYQLFNLRNTSNHLVQAVLDDNLVMVRLLIHHGAKLDKLDEDCWTPLHAAAANGLRHIAK